jgi:hypothetical protein
MLTAFVLQVAVEPRSGGSGHESDGSSSGASLPQQQSRPVRGAQGSMDAALSQQQVRIPVAAQPCHAPRECYRVIALIAAAASTRVDLSP